jgi:hypothetical protein
VGYSRGSLGLRAVAQADKVGDPVPCSPECVERGFDGSGRHRLRWGIFYLGLALDPNYVDGFVEGCLERIGEDDPDEEQIFRDLWDGDTQRDVVIESLKADCEVKSGRPAGL